MKFDANVINEIIKSVVKGISDSRYQIVNIVDNINHEVESLKLQLDKLKENINRVIEEVDDLERMDRLGRRHLAEVSANFYRYTEKDIKAAYEKASNARTRFLLKQNEEMQLRKQRDSLEIRIKNTILNVEQGERIINQISIAMNYLEGDVLSAIYGADKNSDMVIGMRILEAQERERKRIARDIHDGPAQHMANVVMKTDICKMMIKKDLAEGLEELDALKESVKIALKEVRRIIFNLRPMSLEELGLIESIKQTVGSITQDSGISVEYNMNLLEEKVENIIQVALYRLIQEIFNNMVKHSKATRAELKLSMGNQYLTLIISDDGEGFKVEDTLKKVREKGTSYGLIGIIDRVKQLQGEIKIQSEKGLGTTYIIKLPINREVIGIEKARS